MDILEVTMGTLEKIVDAIVIILVSALLLSCVAKNVTFSKQNRAFDECIENAKLASGIMGTPMTSRQFQDCQKEYK